jgi:phage shock protein A
MVSTRGVGPLVKTATNLLSEIPGGERLVLQAVKDMLDELRQLRRKNAQLTKRNEALTAQIERLRAAKKR